MTMNCLAKPTQRTARTRSTARASVPEPFRALAQQRYAKSNRILANCRGVKDFRRFRNSQDGTWFWRLDSDRILKLVLREIILSQEIQMPPGGRRAIQGLREGRCDQTQQRLLIEPETTHTASD